ncbi:hypothetical protein [Trichoplusia ni single nucleopolyhedrovirus]|uniref:Uncharacterized protein n=1 Tax=Trichoplusia ni single nucleopolyhedrovirus TaxID=332054 RepID=Q462B4_9ABAC|nr:hypothetical protein TNSV_gp051 [Trichoplusia ni single nucleopolyhedrovirus]AAZ67422.1 hypothetical protein [Trichoplusia ni single nucleopolyhedrovirus]
MVISVKFVKIYKNFKICMSTTCKQFHIMLVIFHYNIMVFDVVNTSNNIVCK